MNKAAKELANARTECAEREAVIASLKLDIQNKGKISEEEAEKVSSIQEEVFCFTLTGIFENITKKLAESRLD